MSTIGSFDLEKGSLVGFVLANGSMSSNQSGDCPVRSAMKTPKAKPQSLPRQRDIRRASLTPTSWNAWSPSQAISP